MVMWLRLYVPIFKPLLKNWTTNTQISYKPDLHVYLHSIMSGIQIMFYQTDLFPPWEYQYLVYGTHEIV